MKRRVHPVTGLLVIAIAIVFIGLMLSRKLNQEGPGPLGEVGGEGVKMVMPQGAPEREPTLGIVWSPNMGTPGVTVVAFLERPGVPSRLKLAGARPDDIVLGANADKTARLADIDTALDALITKGTPFTLNLIRGGQQVQLKVTKLPEKVPTTAEIEKMIAKEREDVTGPPLPKAAPKAGSKGARRPH